MSDHKFTVRGVEYTVTSSLYINQVSFIEAGVSKTLDLKDVGFGLPSYSKDSNGDRTSEQNVGKLKLSYTSESKLSEEVFTKKMPDIYSNDTEYEAFYTTVTKGEAGLFVHKAALNAIIKANAGSNDFVSAYNPAKDFAPFQPIVFDITSSTTGVTVSVVNSPGGSLVYSIDGFETMQPLSLGEIPVTGEGEIAVMSQEDGFPSYKPFNIVVDEEV